MSDQKNTKAEDAVHDEPEIIRRCQGSRLEDFGLIYDRYIRQIYNFIYYKTMHRETAEDLASLTFLKALENLDRFDPDRGSFSAWLYAIARNSVKDYYRTKKNDANVEDIFDLAGGTDPSVDAENRLIFEKVSRYLGGLKPEQREVVTMRLWEGLPYRDIAAALGMTEANCKMIFSRTMAKLRQDLALLLAYLISIFL